MRQKPANTASKADSQLWAWIALGVILIATAAIRIRLLQIPLERDEGEFAYMGQLILQGVPPYSLAYNMKFPGIYAAYALIMAVFGQSIAGIHIGLLLVNAATIVLVFLLARRLIDSWTGVVAAGAYALLSISPSVLGTSAHATHFVILPALGGILLLLKADETERLSTLFWSGILLGLGFIMKQPGILFIIFAALYLFWRQIQVRSAWAHFAARIGLLLAGSAIPFLLACLILRMAGVFDRFWFWTFTYAKEYATSVPLSTGLWILSFRIQSFLRLGLSLWILAGIGLTALIWDKRLRPNALFLIGFLVLSFLAVCPGLYFREHYFVLILPAVAVPVGAAISSLSHILPRKTAWIVPALVLVLSFGHSVWKQGAFLFQLRPSQISRAMYGYNPFVESPEIARYIKAHSSKNDKIAILGSEPQILFYSDRRSATGHIYMYGLMENQPYAPKMQEEMIQEIEAAKPKYMIFVNVSLSWMMSPQSDKLIIKWFDGYLINYKQVGVIDIKSLEHTDYYWDEKAAEFSPTEGSFIQVYERTSN